METTIDIAGLMSDSNRTLELANRQTSGWQKNLACSIGCRATLSPHQLQLGLCSTRCSAWSPSLSVWLAYQQSLQTPLQCPLHGAPIHDGQLYADRITFSLVCSGSCFFSRPICVVVAECLPQQQSMRWNYVTGDYRRLKKEQHRALTSDIGASALPRYTTEDLIRKLDNLISATAELTLIVRDVVQRQQIIMNQGTVTTMDDRHQRPASISMQVETTVPVKVTYEPDGMEPLFDGDDDIIDDMNNERQ